MILPKSTSPFLQDIVIRSSLEDIVTRQSLQDIVIRPSLQDIVTRPLYKPSLQEHLNSQAPETTCVPGARCARSSTNGQAVVRSFQNFHGRFRTCLKPELNIYLRLKLFLTLKEI